MTAPGPAVLGRGVVVGAQDPVPADWAGRPEIDVRDESCVDALHRAWATRAPVVLRLHTDPARWRTPVSEAVEPWTLDPAHDLPGDRLHHLIWANTYDARGGATPVWWWARKAARLGATEGGGADVVVDGRELWIDGGPRGPLELPHIHAESVDLGRLRVAPAPRAPRPEIALAPDQLAAVAHGSGPARIVAPAGSGKTRVLTERLRHLLGDRAIERDLVCAVAYNRRAQEELAQRCAGFRPRVVTLNALGWELLGRPPVLEEREVRRVIERLVPAPRRRANVDPIGPYLEALGRVRLGLVDPAVVEEERDDVPGLTDAFPGYREELRRRGAVDFDEQIYAAVERLLADGAFRRAQQARHRHLLVDELQDLTPAHVLLIRLLALPALDVFGVGDDDQVIYGHAGADPAFLLGFDQLFPGAADHPLEVNYRCRPAVVDAARALLAHNRRRVPKVIRAGRTDAPGSSPALRIVTHPATAAAERLVEVVAAERAAGTAPGDIAVLARVNSLLLAPQVALTQAGVPVAGALDERVLERTGTRAALAYLRIATAPGAFAAADVLEILRRPSRGLPVWIDRWFRTPTVSVTDIRRIAGRLDDAKVAAKVESLADDLDLVRRAGSGTTRSILRTVRVRVGLGEAMSTLDAQAAASHLDDLEALEQVADLHPDPAGFEAWLRGVLGRSRAADGAAAAGDGAPAETVGEGSPVRPGTGRRTDGADPVVTLATVHRVKGQEWPVVVLVGVAEGLMPHRLTEDVEEERRVLHVGLTRGIERVVVLADEERPSRFLAELDPSVVPPPVTAPSPSPVGRGAASRGPVTRPGGRGSGSSAGSLSGSAVGGADGSAVGGADPVLLERLRAWRGERARRDGVPAYVVLHDKHLQAIAAARPADARALARVEGMGPRRLELYADEILALVGA